MFSITIADNVLVIQHQKVAMFSRTIADNILVIQHQKVAMFSRTITDNILVIQHQKVASTFHICNLTGICSVSVASYLSQTSIYLKIEFFLQ